MAEGIWAEAPSRVTETNTGRPIDVASRRESLILLAGLFWGEGCVSITRSRFDRHQLFVTVGNTDPEMIGRFAARFGGTISGQPATERCQSRASWTLTGLRACDVLDEIAPHLGGVKREAAEVGRRWRALTSPRGKSRRVVPEIWAAREALRLELKQYTDPMGIGRGRKRGVSYKRRANGTASIPLRAPLVDVA